METNRVKINWYMVDDGWTDGWRDCLHADATETAPRFVVWHSRADGFCWGAWEPGQTLTLHYGLGYKNSGYAATAAQKWLDDRRVEQAARP